MVKKYRVALAEEEQQELKGLVSRGRVAAYRQTHARILLLCDENQANGSMKDEEIARALKVGTATVERVRRRCVEEGLKRALGRKEQLNRRPKKLDGHDEAQLIALACSQPPEGRASWTPATAGGPAGGMRDSGQHQHRNRAPDTEKNELKPWLKECWCIPPQGNAEFVCAPVSSTGQAMEDVLEVYQRQFGDNEVLVCLDETSKQLVKETRQPLPPQPGAAMAYDYEYERNGVSNLFMLFAPLEGWRRVEVTDRRTKADWAEVVRKLVDEDYPDRERIVLVMDNLNTHHPASLYEAFPPEEARRIAERLEIHYTPKHGSWLNMAEIELGVLTRQCLDRRIPSQETLKQETQAWQGPRNRNAIRVDWRFTTEDARIKLKSLYPSLQR